MSQGARANRFEADVFLCWSPSCRSWANSRVRARTHIETRTDRHIHTCCYKRVTTGRNCPCVQIVVVVVRVEKHALDPRVRDVRLFGVRANIFDRLSIMSSSVRCITV